jgi:type IV secretory pathway TrbL component
VIGILAAADPILSFGGIEGSGGVLNDVLATFTRLLNNGAQKVVSAEKDLCGALLMLQFLKMMMELGLTKRVVWRAVFGFLGAWCWYQAACNAVAISGAFAGFMGSLGSALSDGPEQGTDIMSNPSGFIVFGGRAFTNLYEQTNKFSVWDGLPFAIFFIVVGFLVFFCYMILGLVVMWVTVKAKLDILLGLSLIPFIIEDNLKVLAGVGMGLIISAGMRLGATSLAVGSAYSFLSQITLPPEPTTGQAIRLLLAAVGCAFISGGVAVVTKGLGATLGVKRLLG